MSSAPRIVVVGAGAFGGWTALELQRRLRAAGSGSVTLVDAWGAGHPRASSGGETRMLRGVYGPHPLYTEWVLRALDRWRRAEVDWGVRLFRPTGLLWLLADEVAYVEGARPCCEAAGWPLEELSVAQMARRFPQVSTDGVSRVFWEEGAGYLLARRGTEAVAAAVTGAGGEVRLGAVRRPLAGDDGRLSAVELADGSRLPADLAVFACGPWTGELFPGLLGRHLVLSRQEVFYFGPPAGDRRFAPLGEGGDLPAWIDFAAPAGGEAEGEFYSIPGSERRGVKLADDRRGPPLDPTRTERRPSPEALARARRALERRLPGMAGAPLVEARVCQYTNSPDGDFVLDRHPEIEGVWIATGGSGHGYKLGPAVGESLASWILGEGEPDPRFRLDRLRHAGARRVTQFEAV